MPSLVYGTATRFEVITSLKFFGYPHKIMYNVCNICGVMVIFIYVYVHIHIYIYMFMHLYIYIYIYIHVYVYDL